MGQGGEVFTDKLEPVMIDILVDQLGFKIKGNWATLPGNAEMTNLAKTNMKRFVSSQKGPLHGQIEQFA
jgi:hypothetical protein